MHVWWEQCSSTLETHFVEQSQDAQNFVDWMNFIHSPCKL